MADKQDLPALSRLRSALWPADVSAHESTLRAHFEGKSDSIDAVFVAADPDEQLVAFLEARIRDYAEGSENSAVPYVEGWYVSPEYRRRGIGVGLLELAESWATSLGYHEIASNALLGNSAAEHLHLSVGFNEVERSIHFLKRIR